MDALNNHHTYSRAQYMILVNFKLPLWTAPCGNHHGLQEGHNKIACEFIYDVCAHVYAHTHVCLCISAPETLGCNPPSVGTELQLTKWGRVNVWLIRCQSFLGARRYQQHYFPIVFMKMPPRTWDGHGVGENNIRNAVSSNIIARCRARGEKG